MDREVTEKIPHSGALTSELRGRAIGGNRIFDLLKYLFYRIDKTLDFF